MVSFPFCPDKESGEDTGAYFGYGDCQPDSVNIEEKRQNQNGGGLEN